MKVRHDGKVWDVVEATPVDDDPGYLLSRPGTAGFIVARTSECKPCRNTCRRLRDDRHILECTSGTFTIRRKHGKRYTSKGGRVPAALRPRRRR